MIRLNNKFLLLTTSNSPDSLLSESLRKEGLTDLGIKKFQVNVKFHHYKTSIFGWLSFHRLLIHLFTILKLFTIETMLWIKDKVHFNVHFELGELKNKLMITRTFEAECKLQYRRLATEVYNLVKDLSFLLSIDFISNPDSCNISKHTQQFWIL